MTRREAARALAAAGSLALPGPARPQTTGPDLPADAALLVIDVQRAYTMESSPLYCEDCGPTIARINELIELFEARSRPVLYIRHLHRADGSDLGRMFDYLGAPAADFDFKQGSEAVEYDSRLRRPASAPEILKTRYSSFVGTTLEESLSAQAVRTVAICGFMTNFCCESAARDAHDRDYFVDFLADATGTPGTETIREPEMRRIVEELLGAGFARVHQTSAYLQAARG